MPTEWGSLDEHTPADRVVDRLQADFPAVGLRRIREVVTKAYESYRDARIRAYVPIFVERESRIQLRAGLIPHPAEAPEEVAPGRPARPTIVLRGYVAPTEPLAVERS